MRVKTGTARRRGHKKVIELTKGYRMTKNRLFRPAQEALLHAGEYAFAGRKRRKRETRKIWIARINAAAREQGLNYHQLIAFLKKANVQLNRKILAHLAVKESPVFQKILETVRKNDQDRSKKNNPPISS